MTEGLPYRLTCLRCGHQGVDVSLKVVDLEAEAKAAGRPVDELTDRYATEYRCRDRAACDQRMTPEETPPWI